MGVCSRCCALYSREGLRRRLVDWLGAYEPELQAKARSNVRSPRYGKREVEVWFYKSTQAVVAQGWVRARPSVPVLQFPS